MNRRPCHRGTHYVHHTAVVLIAGLAFLPATEGVLLSQPPEHPQAIAYQPRARTQADLLDDPGTGPVSIVRYTDDGEVGSGRYRPASDFMTADMRRLILSEMRNKYSDMPPPERWLNLFEHALSKPEDPCEADILSTFGWNSGWGSGFNSLANDVAAAAYFGGTVAVCDPAALDLSRWMHLQGPLRACNRSELCADVRQYDEYGSERRHMPWGYTAIFWGGCLDHDECDVSGTSKMPKLPPGRRNPGISPAFRNFSKHFRHLVYNRLYRFNSEFEGIATHFTWLKRPKKDPYVGVHLRGPEKLREAVPVTMEDFLSHTQRLANLTGSRTVFIASDNYHHAAAFKERLEASGTLSGWMKPELAYTRGEDVVSWAFLNSDVQHLKDAAAFVGTASSNIGRLVYFLRPQRESISHTFDASMEDGDVLDFSVDDDNDFFSRHC